MPTQPYFGEIMPFAGNFAPVGWLPCAGQLLPISQYSTLFTLIGTTYGGDGVNTFALPDLRGRVPIHSGQGPNLSNYIIGQVAGTETSTLTAAQLPSHTHPLATAATGNAPVPNGGVPGPSRTADLSYGAPTPGSTMAAGIMTTAGAAAPQPHENMQPFLPINFCIAVDGIFPPQS